MPCPRPRLANARAVLCCALAGATPAAWADARVAITFSDPSGTHAPYYADLERVATAAGADWLARFLTPSSTLTLSVSIGFAPIATSTGRSFTSALVGTDNGGLSLYAEGAAYEVRTGVDPNGAAPDIEFMLGSTGYLQNELWFDPDPLTRSAEVPSDRTDAYSVLLHEFGHAFGFNGWRDGLSGMLPGGYASSFDALVSSAPGAGAASLFFIGAAAVTTYGAPVPLTLGNYAHFGNWLPGSGADLVPDLMNGLVFYRGTRYGISALDLAVMSDLGLPLQGGIAVVPEPSVSLLLLAGLCLLAWRCKAIRPREGAQDS
ncbi:PEP-CTERM sorting domain-containing protein [Rubrivivax rivuli]|uniref:PEP-CTERM sorting domain-containing protein n=1 Tax=Rubrivivax rivuli TaxID=1862385 RepID=A0A437RE71_9BURK|nr:PEP-CTERM sorting domain-containing protein [Rubrivivax rivuli]RVU45055.1 PEP-CTERM sorting domain-containing protein [Rubrivivax rivuli]